MGTYIAGVSPWEASLMSRVQDREEGAFQELFTRFRHKIFRTALRILKEERSAEDAMQVTFINVYRAADKFRGDSKIGTWVNRITVNVCLEILRRNKKHDNCADDDISDLVMLEDSRICSPFERARRSELQELLEEAFAGLSDRHRAVVRLHDLEGYTIKEIAEKLEVPEGTVKSRLFYGREELKSRLQQHRMSLAG